MSSPAASIYRGVSWIRRRALAMYLDYIARSERKNGFMVKEGVIRI